MFVAAGLVLFVSAATPASAICTANGRTCGVNSAANDRLCCPGTICGPLGNVCQPGCRVNGVAYRSGAQNPINPCQTCQPSRSTTSWSSVKNGIACNDGSSCSLTDSCQRGVCTGANWILCNGSFETGDFTGWTAVDITQPYRALTVGQAGVTDGAFNSFATAPTDGTYAAIDGFDGAGPGVIELSQYYTVPIAPSTLRFDYRAGWDLVPYGATLARTFGVRILSPANQSVLSDTVLLTANPGTNVDDSGPQAGSLDLAPWMGQTVIIEFYQDVPQFFTGPGLFQLDNVRVTTP